MPRRFKEGGRICDSDGIVDGRVQNEQRVLQIANRTRQFDSIEMGYVSRVRRCPDRGHALDLRQARRSRHYRSRQYRGPTKRVPHQNLRGLKMGTHIVRR
jgi:hypothetical protein